MKSLFTAALAFSMLFGLSTENATAQELPQPSTSATVMQRIGLTDFTVKYSRPSVKGRTIWGDLVPFGELWRTGANGRTQLTITDDIKIGGKDLKAGTYGILTRPTEGEWDVIFSSDIEQWGVGDYDASKDVLTLKVKSGAGEFTESLSFGFENVINDKGELVLRWDKLRLAIPIEVNIHDKAMANIEKAISEAKEDDFRVYRNAAKYCAESNTNLERGLAWIEKSIKMKESWYSYWVKADVHAAMKETKKAIASAEKAIELGEAAAKKDGSKFNYGDQLREEITKWKTSMK